MRALLPERQDDIDIHAHYARDWVARGGVRMNFVASVDGAVSADGVSGGLQTPGDNAVFAALRDLADCVLVGAETVLAEDYGRPVPDADADAVRAAHGLPAVLQFAIISRTGRGLTPDRKVFADGDGPPPLVLTTAAADVSAVASAAEIVVVGDEQIDYARLRRELAARDLTRVLCEGGPTVFAQLAEAGQVDELCLSVSPLLAGPGPGRITSGNEWSGPLALELDGQLEEDGALFLRYSVR